jgi:uncharacterized protein YdbL (DUF1318 family)
MRVDVYQHVVKDVESIEDEIFGNTSQQFNSLLLQNVYAADYTDEVRLAIEQRKVRMPALEGYLEKGYIGENRHADLQVLEGRAPQELNDQLQKLVAEENRDRATIYQAVAQEREAQLSEVRKILFKDHYNRARAGFWFEVFDQAQGQFTWKQK